jgi:hypothetical protein
MIASIMATPRISPERAAALAEAEQLFIWGEMVEGKQAWPSLSVVSDRTKLPYKFVAEHSKRGKWAERRSQRKAVLAADAHEKSRRRWAEMNRQVVEVHHQTVTRLTRLINDDISLKERMVQRAKNEELVQRGLGNDDAVVPFGFKSTDLLDLARAVDLTEKNHARVMARAQALPLMVDPADPTDDGMPEEEEVPTLTRLEDIISTYFDLQRPPETRDHVDA